MMIGRLSFDILGTLPVDVVHTAVTVVRPGRSIELVRRAERHALWNPSTVWPGVFIASAEVRRTQLEPGRARFWVGTPLPLIRDEPVSRPADAAGLFDIANRMTIRVSPRKVTHPRTQAGARIDPGEA
jgi:hypothetical protein